MFSASEAVLFLQRRTSFICEYNAIELAKRLDFLPLALEQAAAYVLENGIIYDEYLELLDEYGLLIMEEYDHITDYTRSVNATFAISINKIKMSSAKDLIYLCAYFAPDNIDFSILLQPNEFLPDSLKNIFLNKIELNRIIKELTKYSLLKHENKIFHMHRLLQKVIQNQLEGNHHYIRLPRKLFTMTG